MTADDVTDPAPRPGGPSGRAPGWESIRAGDTTDAQGVCEFSKVPPGDYFVNELDLPDGYTPDPDLPAAVSIDPFEDVDLSDDDNDACAVDVTAGACEWFVNTAKTGTVVITKQVVDGAGEPIELADATYLDGIAFELQDGGSTVQKRHGGDATCTLELDDPRWRQRELATSSAEWPADRSRQARSTSS